jgi:hypothetical protein
MFPAQVLDVTPLLALLNSELAVLSLNLNSKLNKSHDRIDGLPCSGRYVRDNPGPPRARPAVVSTLTPGLPSSRAPLIMTNKNLIQLADYCQEIKQCHTLIDRSIHSFACTPCPRLHDAISSANTSPERALTNFTNLAGLIAVRFLCKSSVIDVDLK